MKYGKIVATGSYLPVNVVTNSDIEKSLETSESWIKDRTGIDKRHIVSPTEDSLSLAIKATSDLITKNNFDKNNIDMIVVATCTPNKLMPSTACLLHKNLEIANIPAFDINSACSGFIYALEIANKFIASGSYKNILVVGTDTMSRIVDWTDRSTSILFGDGAGAAILQASDEVGILATSLSCDGSGGDLLKTRGDILKVIESPYIEMKGKEVFKKAVKHLSETVTDLLDKSNLKASDISWLIPHQANKRIIEAVASKVLSISMDKVIMTIAEHANTSAASVPLALDFAINSGKVKPGDILLLEAFGAGFTWGGVIIKY